MKEIKKYRLFVSIANLKIIVKRDLEKPKTEEKSKSTIAKIVKLILLVIMVFIE